MEILFSQIRLFHNGLRECQQVVLMFCAYVTQLTQRAAPALQVRKLWAKIISFSSEALSLLSLLNYNRMQFFPQSMAFDGKQRPPVPCIGPGPI